MLQHTEQVDIDRPQAEVYEFLADPENEVQWRKEVVSSELVAGERKQPGARYRQVMKPGRREMIGTQEIVALDPPSRVEWRTPPGEGRLDFAGWWDVQPRNGGSRVEIHAEVRPRGVFKLAEPFMRGFLRKISAQYAQDLKRVLEERSAPA